jgi:transketolase
MNRSMRDAFLDELYDIAQRDRNVLLISNDFGAPSLDKFRADLAGQFIHIGIAEQNMVNVATGLTMAGKRVYVYSIAPFLPLRCLEQIRVHMAFKGYPVTGVMVGAGFSYDLSGPTHQALEDIAIMNALPGMTIFNGSDPAMGAALARLTYEEPGPKYVRFDREKLPALYADGERFADGLGILRKGRDLTMVATGIMTHRALEVAGELSRRSVDAGVIDLYRLKPVNEDLLLEAARPTGRVLTIEESFVSSGIGSIVSGIIARRNEDVKLKCLGIPDRYFTQGGDRANLQRLCGLDRDSIVREALGWLGK